MYCVALDMIMDTKQDEGVLNYYKHYSSETWIIDTLPLKTNNYRTKNNLSYINSTRF
jgi:hypothetical protein